MEFLRGGTAMTTMTVAAPETAAWIERMARLGYAAKALLYGTIGILTGKAALGLGGEATDTAGAMAAIVGAPFGRTLLSACAVGLVGYALWRIIAGVVDSEDRGSDLKGLALRASFIARALFHLVLAWSAVRVVLGRTPVSREKISAAADYGILILVGIGAGFAGYGLYQLYRSWAAKLSRQIDHREMTREAGPWVYPVARFGIAARGAVFCLIGYLTLKAAVTGGSNNGSGLRESLQVFQEIGKVPVGVVALGFLAYAFYEVLNVRYRDIRT
jgi:hypothetical protein